MLAPSARGSCGPVASGSGDSRYRLALWLCRFAVVLSLAVILLGGWTRLSRVVSMFSRHCVNGLPPGCHICLGHRLGTFLARIKQQATGK